MPVYRLITYSKGPLIGIPGEAAAVCLGASGAACAKLPFTNVGLQRGFRYLPGLFVRVC